MDITEHQRNQSIFIARAAEMIAAPVRPVTFAWEVEHNLKQHLRLVERRNLESEHALLCVTNGPKGQHLESGLERYVLEFEQRTIPLVKVLIATCDTAPVCMYDFWVVPVADYRRLYRFIRRLDRKACDINVPIMTEHARQRLWDNTIGFLQHGREVLRKYDVPQKRGVLLLGEPGNGKTTACRWLYSQCGHRGLAWRDVSPQTFEQARDCGNLKQLFELDAPGIILFDDFDQAFRDREEVGANRDLTTFLTELDGLRPRQGVVYIFTSNADLERIDPAFRRPGRIDLTLLFPRPEGTLRRRYIQERWHHDIIGALSVDRVVGLTEDLSFAELEEIKRLLVMDYLDSGAWDWARAWTAFQTGRTPRRSSQRIGFQQGVSEGQPMSAERRAVPSA